jgi:iron complex outermembrane receptor protein
VPGDRRCWPRLVPLHAHGAQTLARTSDLADLSLEQLGNIVVTSVARRPEVSRVRGGVGLRDHRGGHPAQRRDPRCRRPLRLAPNLDVARADANQYAVSARGFNNVLANKLLVLIDGRTVYSPLFLRRVSGSRRTCCLRTSSASR